jgi:hypothetical protein
LTILRRLTVENGEPLLVCLTGKLGLKRKDAADAINGRLPRGSRGAD